MRKLTADWLERQKLTADWLERQLAVKVGKSGGWFVLNVPLVLKSGSFMKLYVKDLGNGVCEMEDGGEVLAELESAYGLKMTEAGRIAEAYGLMMDGGSIVKRCRYDALRVVLGDMMKAMAVMEYLAEGER